MQSRTRGAFRPPRVQHVSAFQLQTFAHRHLLHQRVWNAEVSNQVFAEHFDAAFGNSTHRELRMTRHAEFSNQDDVQRRLEQCRHFAGDRHAASWESEHNHIGTPPVSASCVASCRPASVRLRKRMLNPFSLVSPCLLHSISGACGVSRFGSGTSVKVASVDENARHRHGIFQRDAHNLGRIDDASLDLGGGRLPGFRP